MSHLPLTNQAEPGRSPIRLPHPLWMGVATIALFVVGLGLRIGVPLYSHRESLRQLRQWGAVVVTKKGGPIWVRRLIGDFPMQFQDPVYQIVFPRCSDSDLARAGLARHSQLTVLILTGTDVGDAGMSAIRGLKSLRVLSLDGTEVTDAGLEDLKELTGLQHVNLDRTKVTAAGVASLQRALPKLIIASAHSSYGPYPLSQE